MSLYNTDKLIAASPIPNAASFGSSYIHSVQLTPVVDDYRISGGRIRSWEERVMSHNAGLPFDAPRHGRFIVDSPWLIVRGGRMDLGVIAYRVGNEEFGKNRWRLPPFREIEAYKKYPSQRVFISAEIRKLKDAEVVGLAAFD